MKARTKDVAMATEYLIFYSSSHLFLCFSLIEGSDVISVLIDKTMKSIEKKLIIVKNRGLNSTIYYDLMSEKNFLLND